MSRAVLTTIATVAVLIAGCGAASQAPADSAPVSEEATSIAGTYRCGPEAAGDDRDLVELAADGSLTITHPGGPVEEGTWTFDGTTGMFMGTESFTLEGDELVFADGTVCAPA